MLCSAWDQVCCCDEVQAVEGPHLLWVCGSPSSEVLKCMGHFEPAVCIWLCGAVGSGLWVLLVVSTRTDPWWGSSNDRQERRCLALPMLGRQQILHPGPAWLSPKHSVQVSFPALGIGGCYWRHEPRAARRAVYYPCWHEDSMPDYAASVLSFPPTPLPESVH